ncbi:hypothetical protein FPV67DRAFT_1449249 [Lyophyllum atratum]|nr:hypothetical protein FPV67DRAFT_1449249 [Lyophyllum atratum]
MNTPKDWPVTTGEVLRLIRTVKDARGSAEFFFVGDPTDRNAIMRCQKLRIYVTISNVHLPTVLKSLQEMDSWMGMDAHAGWQVTMMLAEVIVDAGELGDKHGVARRVASLVKSWYPEIPALTYPTSSAFGVGVEKMANNARGPHFFSILGHDRQIKPEPRLSEFHRKNETTIERLMCEGGTFARINKIMENHVAREFPRIAKRFRESETVLKEKYGVERMFGPFWSFCVNAPRYHHGIQRVHCCPHVDALNLAIGICVVFVYDINKHIVTGELEDPYTGEHQANRCWWGGGSVVWFNQAVMFQTAELGVASIKEAKAAGIDATCNANAWIEQKLFPQALQR